MKPVVPPIPATFMPGRRSYTLRHALWTLAWELAGRPNLLQPASGLYQPKD